MNFRIITKYRAADPEIRFFTKPILKPYGYATAMPPALELRRGVKINLTIITKNIQLIEKYGFPLNRFSRSLDSRVQYDSAGVKQ